MNARKKEMAVIDTKERLLRFFSASATTGMPVFFLEKQAMAGVQKQRKRVRSKKKEKLT
jgi:hypothetical protein